MHGAAVRLLKSGQSHKLPRGCATTRRNLEDHGDRTAALHTEW